MYSHDVRKIKKKERQEEKTETEIEREVGEKRGGTLRVRYPPSLLARA